MEMAETKENQSAVESLIETLEDGGRGLALAADRLASDGREELASTMRGLSDQRARMAHELREATGADEERSARGTLHRSWMAVRDALIGGDPHAILVAAEEGEDLAVDEYRKAVRSDLTDSVRRIVERQAAAIKTAHDKVKALRDSSV